MDKTQSHTWVAFIDGASRRNPGKSGAGIFIKKDGETVCKEGFYLGIKTNNQAEYLALLLALYILDRHASPSDTIRIASDSELLVKQMSGIYRVKNEGLQPLYLLAKKYFETYPIELLHVTRDNNTEADALANKGIDTKKSVPDAFKELLATYQATLEW